MQEQKVHCAMCSLSMIRLHHRHRFLQRPHTIQYPVTRNSFRNVISAHNHNEFSAITALRPLSGSPSALQIANGGPSPWRNSSVSNQSPCRFSVCTRDRYSGVVERGNVIGAELNRCVMFGYCIQDAGRCMQCRTLRVGEIRRYSVHRIHPVVLLYFVHRYVIHCKITQLQM